MGLVGNIAPLVATAAAAATAEHDFLSDTISDLARGPHKWIMDTGFYMNAAGLLALAIGAAHVHLGRAAWSLGLFCLSFLALVIVMLGLWDAFHTGPAAPDTLSVHTRLSYFLGPLYLAGPLLMARGARRVARIYAWLFVVSAALWAAFAVPYKLAPTSYDGVLEKIAVAATMLWTVPLAWLFLVRGLRRRHRLTGRGAAGA